MPTLAPALFTLRRQVDEKFPGRRTASDGWIGDKAHASRGGADVSQHNPNEHGVVTAIDITEDLAIGLDCNRLMAELDASNDPRIFYLIHDREIDNSDDSRAAYKGANPHVLHLHVSSWPRRPDLYNDAREWNVPILGGAVLLKPVASTGPRVLERGAVGADVRALQAKLAATYPAYRHKHGALAVDGDFGPKTEAWVKEFQRRSGLTVDGVVGPKTRAKLGL